MKHTGGLFALAVGATAWLAAASAGAATQDPPQPSVKEALALFASEHHIAVENIDRVGDEAASPAGGPETNADHLGRLLQDYGVIMFKPAAKAGSISDALPTRIVIISHNGPGNVAVASQTSPIAAPLNRRQPVPAAAPVAAAPLAAAPSAPEQHTSAVPPPSLPIAASQAAPPQPVTGEQSPLTESLQAIAAQTSINPGQAANLAAANATATSDPPANSDMASLTQSASQQVKLLALALRHAKLGS